MKRSYKIEVDCANCANKMEDAAKKTPGVKDAVVNFMLLKMNVEFEDGQNPKEVMQDVLKNCKKVEADCEIFLRCSFLNKCTVDLEKNSTVHFLKTIYEHVNIYKNKGRKSL